MDLVKRINHAINEYGGRVLSTIQYQPNNNTHKSPSYGGKALTAAAVAFLALTAANARSAPVYDNNDWDFPIQISFTTPTGETLSDTFTPGVKPEASDGYDSLIPFIDTPQPPTSPSGAYTQSFSIVDGYALTCDRRSPLEPFAPKTWEIIQVVVDPYLFQDPSGTIEAKWDLSKVPSNIELTLNMNGSPINMRAYDHCSLYVTNIGPWQHYLTAELIPEPSTMALFGLGGLAFLKRRKNPHTPL